MNWQPRRTLVNALACLTIAAACAAVPTALAEWDGDLRGGVNTDAEGPFVGAGLLTPFGQSSSWYFNPNAEYTAGDNADMLSINADVHYDLPTDTKWTIWVGGGPAFLTVDPEFGEDDDNDVGVNFLAGTGARTGNVRPFVQGKVVAADDTSLLIAGGIRW